MVVVRHSQNANWVWTYFDRTQGVQHVRISFSARGMSSKSSSVLVDLRIEEMEDLLLICLMLIMYSIFLIFSGFHLVDGPKQNRSHSTVLALLQQEKKDSNLLNIEIDSGSNYDNYQSTSGLQQ